MLRKFLTHPLLRNILFVLLLSGIAFASGYFAIRYSIQSDITHNASNSSTNSRLRNSGEVKNLRSMAHP